MICYLKGEVFLKQTEFVILNVNGVGYEVLIPSSLFSNLSSENETVEFYIYTYIREDSLKLYGFFTMFNRQVFEMILNVSGIGPKVALALLSAIDGFELCEAILTQQIAILTKIPGIGSKTAERLVLELKTKCQKLISRYQEQKLFNTHSALESQQYEKNLNGKSMLEDLNSALLNMGYKEKQISTLLHSFYKRLKYGENLIFEDMLKESLKKLSKHVLKE